MTGIASVPASNRSTNSSRASAGHGSESVGAVAASRSSESRLITVPCSAAACRGAQREQASVAGRHRSSDAHLGVAQHQPVAERAIASWRCDRAGRVVKSARVATHRRSSTRSRAAAAMSAISASPPGNAECVGHPVLLLQREHVARPTGTPLQLDARASKSVVYAVARLSYVVLEQDCAAACAQCSECTSRNPPATFLEIRFEHERDFTGRA